MNLAAKSVAKEAGVDLESGEPPLYQRIAQTLQAEISSGTFAVDTMLPTESELCERFDVSRHTIRDALRVLSEQGMVSRRRGSGTLVASVAPTARYVQAMRSLEELTQYAHDTRYEIQRVERVSISPDLALIIPAPAASTWVMLEGRRWRPQSNEPICATAVFVHTRFEEHLHDVRTTEGPIYDLVERRSGEHIAEVVQEISADPLPRNAAKALKLRSGAPSLRFVRRYIDESGSTMLTSMNWHPADHFTYRMRLRRGA
ncbi:GntR family transcriptional regulator [Leptospira interrogans]